MKKARQVAVPDRDDRRMILDPDRWPRWPFLPVKRGNHSLADRNLGVLLCTESHVAGRMIVYHGYLFLWPQTPEEVKALPKTEYDGVDALLADGWVVD